VNPDDLSNDSDPRFMAEFYKNLKILSQDLFKKSAVAQTNFRNTATNAANPAPLRRVSKQLSMVASNSRPSLGGFNTENSSSWKDLSSAALAAAAFGENVSNTTLGMSAESAFQTHPEDYFAADSLMERMKNYAQQGGIPMHYIERYAQLNKHST
jgi:hypothetical protein